MTTDAIASAKHRYGAVGLVVLHDLPFYYRLLTVEEYGVIASSEKLDQTELEETICQWCLLDPAPPVDWEAFPDVTLATRLANVIVQESRFESVEALQEATNEARTRHETNVLSFLIVQVCSVFQHYTPRALRQLTLPQLLDEVVYAEKVLRKPLITPNLFKPGHRGPHPIPQAPHPSTTGAHRRHFRSDAENLETSMDVSTQALADVMAGRANPTPLPRVPYPAPENSS